MKNSMYALCLICRLPREAPAPDGDSLIAAQLSGWVKSHEGIPEPPLAVAPADPTSVKAAD